MAIFLSYTLKICILYIIYVMLQLKSSQKKEEKRWMTSGFRDYISKRINKEEYKLTYIIMKSFKKDLSIYFGGAGEGERVFI